MDERAGRGSALPDMVAVVTVVEEKKAPCCVDVYVDATPDILIPWRALESWARVSFAFLFTRASRRRTHDSRHGQASSTKLYSSLLRCAGSRTLGSAGAAGAAGPLRRAWCQWCGSKRLWLAGACSSSGSLCSGTGAGYSGWASWRCRAVTASVRQVTARCCCDGCDRATKLFSGSWQRSVGVGVSVRGEKGARSQKMVAEPNKRAGGGCARSCTGLKCVREGATGQFTCWGIFKSGQASRRPGNEPEANGRGRCRSRRRSRRRGSRSAHGKGARAHTVVLEQHTKSRPHAVVVSLSPMRHSGSYACFRAHEPCIPRLL
jgi:hypothetical protein